MASHSPSSKLPKINARRLIPAPSTRTYSAQRLSYGSSSTSSTVSTSRDLEVSRPSKAEGVAQRSGSSLDWETNIAKPPPNALHAAASSRSGIGRPCSKPCIPVRNELYADSSIARSSNLPRARDLYEQHSSSSMFTSSTTMYSFLTPPNALAHSSIRGKEDPATPKGPRQYSQRKSADTVAAHTPSKKVLSPYQNTHFADACLPLGLVHQLHPCGHKVLTIKPEPCASNCRRPLSLQAVSAFTNILQSTESFVCAACVELHVQSHREMKMALFIEQMDRTELQMSGFPPGWREEQLEYWRRVWENDVQAERTQFQKLGRKCHFIPGEPLQMGDVLEAAAFPSVPSPWPPLRRPLAARSTTKLDLTVPEKTGLENE